MKKIDHFSVEIQAKTEEEESLAEEYQIYGAKDAEIRQAIRILERKIASLD